MKLIVANLEALKGYVTREFYYLITNLIDTHGWKLIEVRRLWNGAGAVSDKLVKEFGELPDTILFSEVYEYVDAHAREIDRLDCRKVFFTDDLHSFTDEMRRMKSVSFGLCDTILSTCAHVWEKFYPEFLGVKKVVWVPHSASRDFRVGFNPHPENAILLSGALSLHYPLRRQMKALYDNGLYAIAYHGHPGYHCRFNYNENDDIGHGYAMKINRYRAAFTDSLVYGYVVAKYFEIPATGALLFADEAVSGPLKQLGFVENEHYLPVSTGNLEARIQYILDQANLDELEAIRRRGQELVWERHKTSDRAQQIDEECSNQFRASAATFS